MRPVIIPFPFREINRFGFLPRFGNRRNEDLIAEGKFIFTKMVGSLFLFYHHYRTQYRKAIAVIFPKSGINIRKKPVAKLDKFTVDGFVFFAEAPRFAFAGITGRMCPHQRSKYAELYPAGKKFAVGLAGETADISS